MVIEFFLRIFTVDNNDNLANEEMQKKSEIFFPHGKCEMQPNELPRLKITIK